MQLPNIEFAEVSKQKIVDYLLNLQHPDGASKARLFISLGFRVEDWQLLAGSLRQVAANYPIVKKVESIHGSKYIIEGKSRPPAANPHECVRYRSLMKVPMRRDWSLLIPASRSSDA